MKDMKKAIMEGKAVTEVCTIGPSHVDFAMVMNGDSMEPVFIDGDIVLLKNASGIPCQGAAYAVRKEDGEVILRWAWQDEKSIILRAANPKYAAVYSHDLSEEGMEVIGVAVGLTRSFENHGRNPETEGE